MRQIRLTDEQKKLAEANMTLVFSVINRMAREGWIEMMILPLKEAEGAGYLGLCIAAATYNPDRGRFSSYAWKIIQNEIRNAAVKHTTVSSPTTACRRKKNKHAKFVDCKSISQIPPEKIVEFENKKTTTAKKTFLLEVDNAEAANRCLDEIIDDEASVLLHQLFWKFGGNVRKTALANGLHPSTFRGKVDLWLETIREKMQAV
jgi:hypothetical protein